jgi:two-component system phosphate regulon sensor histidine kinase PhoR
MLARVASLARAKDLLERVERAEAMSRSLLEGSPDALLAWSDATRRITFANRPAEEALGAPREALVGRPLEEVLPDLALFRGGRGESIPLPDLALNGRVYAPTARQLGGEERATILSLRDVSERRVAETRRLDFYSIIAHDLRGPLGAVLMRSEQVARGRHGPPPAGLVADMRKIEHSVRSMVSLINDFLDMARLESTGYELRREPVNVKRLVQDTAEELRPLLEASGLQWQDDADGADPWVLGDRRRLAQVIHNLVGNAIKFTPAGGRVQARIASRDGEVEITINDTGPGIPPEWLSRVFQRYTRMDASSGAGGSGLGLMIVREIVEAHGGRVGVESTVNMGSTFWVRLPRVDPPAPPETTVEPA